MRYLHQYRPRRHGSRSAPRRTSIRQSGFPSSATLTREGAHVVVASAKGTCRVATPEKSLVDIHANPHPEHPRTRRSNRCGRSCESRQRQLPRNPERNRSHSVPLNCCLSTGKIPADASITVISQHPSTFTHLTRLQSLGWTLPSFHTDPTPENAAFAALSLYPRNSSCIRLTSLVAMGLQTPMTSTGLHMHPTDPLKPEISLCPDSPPCERLARPPRGSEKRHVCQKRHKMFG